MGLERAVCDDPHLSKHFLQSAIDYEVIDITGRCGCNASTRACRPSCNPTPNGPQEAGISNGIGLHIEVGPNTPSQIVVSYVPTYGLENATISL
jgi:hypothetical protein